MSDLFWIAVLGVGLYLLDKSHPSPVFIVSPPSSGGITGGAFRTLTPPVNAGPPPNAQRTPDGRYYISITGSLGTTTTYWNADGSPSYSVSTN